ncbi:MAG TPA: hypothetical protein VK604_27250 [Bryobacteraceae bacterium]|nr:hypothetical protein [Bryobacteraceae bacterium]
MPQLSFVSTDRNDSDQTTVRMKVEISFADHDPAGASAAVDKLIAVLRAGMPEDEVQDFLREFHEKLQAELRSREVGAGN